MAVDGADDLMSFETDVSCIDDLCRLQQAVDERFGGTDVLMNNAGIQPGSTMFGAAGQWQRIVDVNLWGPIRGTQAQVTESGSIGYDGEVSEAPADARVR